MALQTSGAISISDIKAELNNTSNSLRALSAAAGFSTPDSMSEFYGYSAFTPPTIRIEFGCSVTGGTGTSTDPFYVVFDTTTMEDYSSPPDYYWYDAFVGFTVSVAGTYTMHLDFTTYSESGFNGQNSTTSIMGVSPFVTDDVVRNGTSSAAAMVALPERTQTISVTTVPYYDFQSTLRFVQEFYNFYASITAKIWFT